MKIVKQSYLLIFLLLNLNVYGQEKKCEDFKIGNFKYLSSDYSNWTVVRTEKIQTETDSILGIVIQGAIKWKSDCEYELTYIKISNSKLQSLIGKKINVEIKNITGNKIVCESIVENIRVQLEMQKDE